MSKASQSSDIKTRFGRRVRELRKKKGYSQEALGFESGLDRTYISDIERGVRNLSLENIERIANALEVSISQMFKGL